jgi:hypothetical protein
MSDILGMFETMCELKKQTLSYFSPNEIRSASLRQEIAIGPASPRGRNGALQYDLNILRKNLH